MYLNAESTCKEYGCLWKSYCPGREITKGSSTLLCKSAASCANGSQSWVTLCQSMVKKNKALELLHAKSRLIENIIFPTVNTVINAELSFRLSIFPNSHHTVVGYDWSLAGLQHGLKAMSDLIYREKPFISFNWSACLKRTVM